MSSHVNYPHVQINSEFECKLHRVLIRDSSSFLCAKQDKVERYLQYI